MFVIAHILPSDYQPSNDRDELQKIADDLNGDAINAEESDRWIVVHADIHHGLLNHASVTSHHNQQ